MALAHSKLTPQGQISVPAKVRQKLGVGPGSVLEWVEEGEVLVVRRAGKYSSLEIYHSLFPQPPKRASAVEIKEGLRRHARLKYARG